MSCNLHLSLLGSLLSIATSSPPSDSRSFGGAAGAHHLHTQRLHGPANTPPLHMPAPSPKPVARSPLRSYPGGCCSDPFIPSDPAAPPMLAPWEWSEFLNMVKGSGCIEAALREWRGEALCVRAAAAGASCVPAKGFSVTCRPMPGVCACREDGPAEDRDKGGGGDPHRGGWRFSTEGPRHIRSHGTFMQHMTARSALLAACQLTWIPLDSCAQEAGRSNMNVAVSNQVGLLCCAGLSCAVP